MFPGGLPPVSWDAAQKVVELEPQWVEEGVGEGWIRVEEGVVAGEFLDAAVWQ
jgi:hypothetical protein